MDSIHIEPAPAVPTATVKTTFSPAGIPAEFELRETGIHLTGHDEEETEGWLCSPLVVKARFRDAESKGWGRIVEFSDHEGKEHSIPLQDSLLATDARSILGRLVDHGLQVAPGKQAHDAFARLLRDWGPPKTLTSTKRLGWSDHSCSAFVLDDQRCLGNGEFCFTGSAGLNATHHYSSLGTGDDWKANVSVLCVGNPMLILAVSLAFTGPFLELFNQEGGGLHLQGPSSCGKTTIQQVATSVWRNPSVVGSWRTTANGLEETARLCNSMLLPLDELAEIHPKHLDEAIYMLGNGVGKTRANRDGGASPAVNWRLAILSTGELSIVEKLTESGRKPMAGQGVRLLDLDVDTGKFGAFDDLHGQADGAAFSSSLKQAAMRSYGTAGPTFVKALLRLDATRKTVVSNAIDEVTQSFQKKFELGENGQLLRAARRLAVIACAGEIATKAGITGWKSGDALRAATSAMELWLQGIRGNLKDEVAGSKERTLEFLTRHAADFVDLEAGSTAAATPPVGWRDSKYFYFSKESWSLVHGAKTTTAAKALQSIGMFVLGEGNNIGRHGPRSIGRVRVYTVNRAITPIPIASELCEAA